MLVVLTKGANANPVNPFVFDYQHGGDDITCKPRIAQLTVLVTNRSVDFLYVSFDIGFYK